MHDEDGTDCGDGCAGESEFGGCGHARVDCIFNCSRRNNIVAEIERLSNVNRADDALDCLALDRQGSIVRASFDDIASAQL